MSEKEANAPGIKVDCLARVMRFVELEMQSDEAMSFAAHFQDCFECREYAETLMSVLNWRENIRARLTRREEIGYGHDQR
jgi:hypothetical protein